MHVCMYIPWVGQILSVRVLTHLLIIRRSHHPLDTTAYLLYDNITKTEHSLSVDDFKVSAHSCHHGSCQVRRCAGIRLLPFASPFDSALSDAG